MRILLVQPRVTAEPAYPLALAGIIPLLHGAGHTVRGVDLQFDSIAQLQTEIRDFSPHWIGATVLHHNAAEVGRWMEPLSRTPGVQTFVAGALPTLDPASALARTGAHFAVVGVAEETVADLVDARHPMDTPGIVGRPGGKLHTAAPRMPSPLSLLPVPDREVFPLERYSYAMRSTAVPYAAVATSRGCRRFCPYCPVPALKPRGFDARPAEQIELEWRRLVEEFGIRSIHVEDDSFLADPGRIRDLCRRFARSPLGANWELVNGVRPDQTTEEMLHEMSHAGCSRIVFSFEHISPAHAPAVGQDVSVAQRVVRNARAAGLRVGGYFIVGVPGMDLSATIASIKAGLDLDLDDLNFVPFYESPGSAYAHAASSVDATTLPNWLSARLSRLGQLGFFAHPRALKHLSADMIHTPGTAPALVAKAAEVLFRGGPNPLRDTP